jgi:hypothetical protein
MTSPPKANLSYEKVSFLSSRNRVTDGGSEGETGNLSKTPNLTPLGNLSPDAPLYGDHRPDKSENFTKTEQSAQNREEARREVQAVPRTTDERRSEQNAPGRNRGRAEGGRPWQRSCIRP